MGYCTITFMKSYNFVVETVDTFHYFSRMWV